MTHGVDFVSIELGLFSSNVAKWLEYNPKSQLLDTRAIATTMQSQPGWCQPIRRGLAHFGQQQYRECAKVS